MKLPQSFENGYVHARTWTGQFGLSGVIVGILFRDLNIDISNNTYHFYLETRKRVIGKQCIPRSDAA